MKTPFGTDPVVSYLQQGEPNIVITPEHQRLRVETFIDYMFQWDHVKITEKEFNDVLKNTLLLFEKPTNETTILKYQQ